MGLKEIIKRSEETEDKQFAKKKPKAIVVLVIIIVVLFFAFGETSDKSDEKVREYQDETRGAQTYIEDQEEGLEKILKKINRAGDVSVFISIDGGGEKILARDNKSKYSKDGAEESGQSVDEETESIVVMSGKSSAEEPYIVEEKSPRVNGVLVVAEGAADEKVRIEIYEAVKALYGISSHRIKVTY